MRAQPRSLYTLAGQALERCADANPALYDPARALPLIEAALAKRRAPRHDAPTASDASLANEAVLALLVAPRVSG